MNAAIAAVTASPSAGKLTTSTDALSAVSKLEMTTPGRVRFRTPTHWRGTRKVKSSSNRSYSRSSSFCLNLGRPYAERMELTAVVGSIVSCSACAEPATPMAAAAAASTPLRPCWPFRRRSGPEGESGAWAGVGSPDVANSAHWSWGAGARLQVATVYRAPTTAAAPSRTASAWGTAAEVTACRGVELAAECRGGREMRCVVRWTPGASAGASP
mmetsp:Transcript_37916/g.67792  ORF Transcript_37916/g.67792 Transcript_37916/m.67792 type:complete len:214 (+) Transcript_37916:321-962(+)